MTKPQLHGICLTAEFSSSLYAMKVVTSFYGEQFEAVLTFAVAVMLQIVPSNAISFGVCTVRLLKH